MAVLRGCFPARLSPPLQSLTRSQGAPETFVQRHFGKSSVNHRPPLIAGRARGRVDSGVETVITDNQRVLFAGPGLDVHLLRPQPARVVKKDHVVSVTRLDVAQKAAEQPGRRARAIVPDRSCWQAGQEWPRSPAGCCLDYARRRSRHVPRC